MKYYKIGFLRALIPFIIMTGVAFYLQSTSNLNQARGTFFAGIIMTAVTGFSVIYEIEEWSFSRQLLVHFGAMLLTVFPTLLLSGWFVVNHVFDVLKVLVLFSLVGLIFAMVGYLLFTKVFKDEE